MRVDEHADRVETGREELRRLEASGRRLALKDCVNRPFDETRPTLRPVSCRGRRERAYEWITRSDELVRVGVTYFLRDGLLVIVAFEPRNAVLYRKVVQTPVEFSRAMKDADTAYKRLTVKLKKEHLSHRRRSLARQQ